MPKIAVGVVIGRGGDMIKKIQAETGARVQFHQERDDGPGDKRFVFTHISSLRFIGKTEFHLSQSLQFDVSINTTDRHLEKNLQSAHRSACCVMK